MLYLTGITLSMYTDSARSLLFEFLDRYRRLGGIVAFDLNYRLTNCPSIKKAREVVLEMQSRVDIVLPSIEGQENLFGLKGVAECLDHYSATRIKHVVRGCYLMVDNSMCHFPLETEISPVDTTAAGDSFNADYLSALLSGQEPLCAINLGQACAAIVIQHAGEIIDKQVFLNGIQRV